MIDTKRFGKIVTWLDATENIEKRGHAYNTDQFQAIVEMGKVAVTEVDNSGKDIERHGKRVVKLIAKDKVKQIGFID